MGYRSGYTPETLPTVIPLFPIRGILLLPAGELPLNIFEPRYIAMVRDAMAGDRILGILQPCLTAPGDNPDRPQLCKMGCAGKISAFNELEDGRFLITLNGLCRFRVSQELPAEATGYRRGKVTWQNFGKDLEVIEDVKLDRELLLDRLQTYFQKKGYEADWQRMQSVDCETLIAGLSMVCPFTPAEKQGLLEAETPAERGEMLIALLEMGIADDGLANLGFQ